MDWKAGGDPEKIVKTLTAYANDFEEAGSGTVICGVEEDKRADGRTYGSVKGISAAEAQGLRDRVFNLCRAAVSPSIAPQFRSVSIDESKEVLVIWIAASSDINAFKGDEFIRLGDKVTKATPANWWS